MILSDPTAGLISPTLAKLLNTLFREAVPKTGRELARQAGISSAQGNSLLRRLVGLGLVIESNRYPAKLYAINQSHALAPKLEALLGGFDSILEELEAMLRLLPIDPEVAVLYGSVMRGEDHADSDLDLYLAFGDSVAFDKGQLLESTAELSEDFFALTGNSLSVVVQKMSDLATNFDSRSKFLENLLSDGRVLRGRDVLQKLKQEHQWSTTQKDRSD